MNVDAVSMIGTDLLLSFDVTVALPAGVTAGPADLVRFDGTAFSLFFDARAGGIPAGLDVDAAHHIESTGRLLLSFDGAGSVGGVNFTKADVVEFDPATGGWRMAVDHGARRDWAGADLTSFWATASRFPVVLRPVNRRIAEGTPVAFRVMGTDPDGQRLTFGATGLPPGVGIDPATGRITGTPTFAAAGTYTVTVTASDGVLSQSKTSTWTVTNVNRVPVAASAAVTTVEDTPVVVTLSGSDPDGDPLTFTVTSGPAHGALTGTGTTRTYTPAANFGGTDTITFTVSDSTATSAPATVTITVTPGLTLRYWPDVTVVLGGRTVGGADVVQDDLAGTVTPVSIGTLPAGTRVDGYHVLPNGDQLLSFDVTVALPGGITAGPGDVVRFDGTVYTLDFDAAANGIPNGANVDAIAMAGADLLLSFDVTVSLPGGVTARSADLVRFDGSTFSMFFDSLTSEVPAGVNVEATHYFESADLLLLSFDGSGTVGGVTFGKADVLEFNRATGAWRMAVNNSSRAEWRGAALNGLWAAPTAVGPR